MSEEKLKKFMEGKYISWDRPHTFKVLGMELVKTQRGTEAIEYSVLEDGEEKLFTSASKKLARLLHKIKDTPKFVEVERTGDVPNIDWVIKEVKVVDTEKAFATEETEEIPF